MVIYQHIASLLHYANVNLDLDELDTVWARNLILAELKLTGYIDYEIDEAAIEELKCPDTLLDPITAYAVSAGVIAAEGKESFETGIMNIVMRRPGEIADTFESVRAKNPQRAGDWFYDTCIKANYVKLTAIAGNKHWDAKGTKGKLEVTINTAKPEKSNSDIAAALAAKNEAYPLCVICKENEGFDNGVTVRQNLRTIPVTLGGEEWFWQFSPYSYYNQHMIACNRYHVPMEVNAAAIGKLFDFVDYMPHYFIGCNASLPRIGGSILTHDHFQGGYKLLPMHKAPLRLKLTHDDYKLLEIGIIDWYNNAVRISGAHRQQVLGLAVKISEAWAGYGDEAAGVAAATGTEKHNSNSPIVRKDGGKYVCELILRNNRADDKHPGGIFHAHAEYHHIKSEAIGLIEAQGLFILPGRLDKQLAEVAQYVTREAKYNPDKLTPDMAQFKDMIERLLEANKGKPTKLEAELTVRDEVNRVCENILVNTAVFKNDDGFKKFLAAVGIR